MERSVLWSHFKASAQDYWWLSSTAQQSVSWTDDHIHFKCWQTCHFQVQRRGTTSHKSQRDWIFFFNLPSPTGFTEVISDSLSFGTICHSYEKTIPGFIWSLHYGCLWYSWVKPDTVVGWNEKMMPSIEPTNKTGFLWVRGVTCCLNFHASLISTVSQWTWHLVPLKNGIMNLFLSVSLSVWDMCVCGMYCFTAIGELEMAPLLQREDEGIFSSMTELIVLSYLNCQHSGESAAADYQALLSDSPWELCLQHCLAFKHTYIYQVLSSVPGSNSYKL